MIRILPENLSNKIAAGEVAERPSAVVKELVENALDAGATQILVEIEQGGKALVRVSDNGCGMAHDDVLLSLERYATSKIKNDEDLFAIHTLGFRGEALPSIAAVSRFTLVARDQASAAATLVKVNGGKIVNVTATGAPCGTMVEAADLFYNVPARRKFLKSTATEAAHIIEGLAAMAMAHPAVAFTLVHNGKTVKHLTVEADPARRVVEVLGKDLAGFLLPFDGRQGAAAVKGWAAMPPASRTSFSGFFGFVNGRCVRDRTIQQAVMEAYSGRLMKGRFPVAVVFVTLPADQVDVNVHPTKNQVRFAEARGIFELTTAALSRALASTGRSLSRIGTYHGPDVQPVLQAPVDLGRPTVFAREAAITVAGDSALPGTPAIQEDLWPADNGLTRWAIIGLLHGTYVICEGEAGLVLVDQHAAHERVVYERLKQAAASGRPVSQRLLIPEVMELTHRQAAALVAVVDALQDIGFDVEPFGGTSFALRAVPAVLADKAVGPMITDLADQIAESGRPADMGQLLEESLRLMACHHAIRAGQALGPAEMKRLLEQLAACTDPAHCPHGRPTWIVIDRAEIERRFGRRGPGIC